MTTPETRCAPKHPTLRSDRMPETKGGPDNARTLPGPNAHGSPRRSDVNAMDKDTESPADGVDEGLPSAEWVDGYETGKMAVDPDTPGAPRWDEDPVTAIMGWRKGRCGNCGELLPSGDGLRDALRALCDRHEHGALRWADPLPVPEWIAEVRALLDQSTDRPAGDA